jgi:hypothetical protein
MVAKITVPSSIRKALNYNELKAKEGKAECIYAHKFLKEAKNLNFYEKLGRFQSLITLNKRASTNSIHISLNFGLEEKLQQEKLVEISRAYMEKIGFGQQPYLVYQHRDAGHPHIHIVSTNIQSDGRRISLHNIGRNQSSTARKEIETNFGLQRAESEEKSKSEEVKPINAKKLAYGRSEIKRGITNVLDSVLPKYKFATLPELNAVLKLYNLTADRGREGGIIFQKRGLVYRVLDEDGNKIGVPVKSSSIYSKPTLAYLEERFRENEVRKQAFRKNLKTSIDWVMVRPPRDLQAFKSALEKEKISLVIRQNEAGIIYGLTYIDHNTKSVFNGSDIGKEYGAKAILEKCGITQILPSSQRPIQAMPTKSLNEQIIDQDQYHEKIPTQLMDDVISPSEELNYLPYELKKRRKKKRKPNQ